MMNQLEPISHFIGDHVLWANFFIILGVVIEGEFVMIFAGILAHLGILPLFDVLLYSYVGAIFKAISWYSFGNWLNIKFPGRKFFSFVERKVMYFIPQVKEKPFWSIFISKFIYGVSHLTLLFSGIMKINRRVYMKAEAISSVFWVIGMVFLGYFFSHTAFGISHNIRKAFIIILLFVLGFILLERIIMVLIELVRGKDKIDNNSL